MLHPKNQSVVNSPTMYITIQQWTRNIRVMNAWIQQSCCLIYIYIYIHNIYTHKSVLKNRLYVNVNKTWNISATLAAKTRPIKDCTYPRWCVSHGCPTCHTFHPKCQNCTPTPTTWCGWKDRSPKRPNEPSELHRQVYGWWRTCSNSSFNCERSALLPTIPRPHRHNYWTLVSKISYCKLMVQTIITPSTSAPLHSVNRWYRPSVLPALQPPPFHQSMVQTISTPSTSAPLHSVNGWYRPSVLQAFQPSSIPSIDGTDHQYSQHFSPPPFCQWMAQIISTLSTSAPSIPSMDGTDHQYSQHSSPPPFWQSMVQTISTPSTPAPHHSDNQWYRPSVLPALQPPLHSINRWYRPSVLPALQPPSIHTIHGTDHQYSQHFSPLHSVNQTFQPNKHARIILVPNHGSMPSNFLADEQFKIGYSLP